MILAAAVMFFQMQALPPKTGAAVAARQEAVTYAENIPGPAPFGAFSPNLPDNDGTKKTPKAAPVLPDANSNILSKVYIPDHIEPLPPLPDKHYDAVRPGVLKGLSLVFRRARRSKAGRSIQVTPTGSPEGDSPLASD